MNWPVLRALDVIGNAPGSAVLAYPLRVLAVVPAEDLMWVIELPGARKAPSGRTRTYVTGPAPVRLSDFHDHVQASRLCISTFRGPAILTQTDEEVRAQASTPRQKARTEQLIARRESRWSKISPVVCDRDTGKIRGFLELVADPGFPAAIASQASASNVAASTLYSLIHLYWALGSRKNALCTNYWRCGGPGVRKVQRRKLGRKTRLFHAGLSGEGYVLAGEEDKQKLAWGYRLISAEVSPRDAYLLTCGAHWANRVTSDDGVTVPTLFPPDERPSFDQFMYWGKTLNDNKAVAELLLGAHQRARKTGLRGGSLQDMVAMVGQLSAFDSTSTDVYLVSLLSRLKKLPPMTRLIVKEQQLGVILGFYCGWEAPSPRTALMAVFHGAQSKVEYCRRFGIAIQDADIPAMLTRTILADNGELKGHVPTQAEDQFGFGIEWNAIFDSPGKGGVESQHHSDHKKLDHKLPGTNRGKRRERGEQHAALGALWNYFEYMREFIHAVLAHNTEEVPDLAPIAMLKYAPDVRPTRVNILQWLREQGLTAEIACNPEEMRAFMLPNVPAVIRKNGVYPVADVLGYETRLPRLRYTSPELVASGVLAQVAATGNPIRTNLKLEGESLARAWLPTKNGMIALELGTRDSMLRDQLSYADYRKWFCDYALHRGQSRRDDDAEKLAKVLRIQGTTANAKRELAAEAAALQKPMSKASVVRDLRRNRDFEIAYLRDQTRSSAGVPVARAPSAGGEHTSVVTPSAAATAMDRLNAKEFGS